MKTQIVKWKTLFLGGLLLVTAGALADTAGSREFGTRGDGVPNFRLMEETMVHEVTAWEQEHGYYDAALAVVYEGYSDLQLRALSQQGDLLAFRVRHHRMLEDQEAKNDDGLALLTEAAVHGSSYALVDLGYAILLSLPHTEWTLSHAVESLSYFDAAMRRGDYHALARLKSISTVLDQAPGIDWRLFELGQLHAKSAAIYASLSEQRRQLGFDDFDDRRRPQVARFFAGELVNESMPAWLLRIILARFPMTVGDLHLQRSNDYSAL